MAENNTDEPEQIINKRFNRLFLGEGLFETLLIRNSLVEHAERHWQRLHDSARFLNIPFHLTLTAWLSRISALINHERCEHGVVKVILIPKAEERGLTVSAEDSEIIWQFSEYSPPIDSLSLVSLPWHRDSRNPIYHHKTLSYIDNIQAKRYAQSNGADDVVIFDQDGYVLETSCSNLFIVIDGNLYTPPDKLAILPGIMRQVIIESAKDLDLVCIEKGIKEEDLYLAETMFLTNSLIGVLPVSRFDEKLYNINHPIYQLLKR